MTSEASKALIERFRCPEQFATFPVPEFNGTPKGFFKFGEEIVCYGQSSIGTSAYCTNENLPDASKAIQSNGKGQSLPFNPDQVIENLRGERYLAVKNTNSIKSILERASKSAYYALRPVMPASLRAYVKKAYLSGWEQIPFPRWPVDFTADFLLESLLERSLSKAEGEQIPFIWFWPDGFESCSIMTHDVETAAGRDFIETLMDMDKGAGVKASFQLVPEERYEISEKLLSTIRGQGFEVNVHDLNHDGHLFDERRQFLARAEKINGYARQYQAKGYRSGAMYRNQDWYGAFAFEYDMSVPNVAHLDPQHGGCCTAMPYFIGDIVELPLTTAQDYFLFFILNDFTIDLWKRQIEMIRRRHGMISFIVHPDYIIAGQGRETFQELLQHLAALREGGSVWFALPGEVNRWWRQRANMRVVRHQSGWKIEGEGSERARLALASRRGSQLSYHIN